MPPETLAAAEVTEFAVIADLLVFLASAAVVAITMRRIRLAVIPACLITGAVIGPHALGLVPSPEGLGGRPWQRTLSGAMTEMLPGSSSEKLPGFQKCL